jgi:hypothetical protein
MKKTEPHTSLAQAFGHLAVNQGSFCRSQLRAGTAAVRAAAAAPQTPTCFVLRAFVHVETAEIAWPQNLEDQAQNLLLVELYERAPPTLMGLFAHIEKTDAKDAEMLYL